jgi:Cytochrome c554 and c-prime
MRGKAVHGPESRERLLIASRLLSDVYAAAIGVRKHGSGRTRKVALLLLVIAIGYRSHSVWGQDAGPAHPATLADQLATEDRLRKNGWWPTKGSFRRSDFVGDAACARCHAEIAAVQEKTAMAQTATRAKDSALLAKYPLNQKLGEYSYRASVEGQSANYSLDDGSSTFSAPLKWAFGIHMGQSYLLEKNGGVYMAPFTYYPGVQRWDFTVDQSHAVPGSLGEAVGRHLLDSQVRGCFNCHNTAATTSDRFDPEQSISGVRCEACHGPGAYHAAGASFGSAEQGATMIMNPGHLNPVESVDFCGACHRTWWDVTLSGATGIKSLRFPPYRLENSRCWGKGDARLTCIACHDPHRPLQQDPLAYDQKCLSCHLNSGEKPRLDHPGKACPTATKSCVSCHMAKYQVIDIPVKFTDHQIRVVRGDQIPR